MATVEPSSFRDHSNRLFLDGNRVLRGFGEDSAATFLEAHDKGVLPDLVDRGMVVAHRALEPPYDPSISPSHLVVEAERFEFVSLPPEWSFSMLQDAALLTLDINLRLIDDGFILKDSSAYNVTFDGARPVFMDLGSLTRIGERGLWDAYGQFVDHFLAPLFLEAYTGVPFQGMLKSAVNGIPVSHLNRLLKGRARRRRGVTTHVLLRSRLDDSASGYGATQRADVARTELPREVVKSTLVRVRRLVASLSSSVTGTWTDYESSSPYDEEVLERKAGFIEAAAQSVAGGTLIDAGSNTGRFTMVAQPYFDHAIALDVDPGAVDAMYRRLRSNAVPHVTPLVVDLTNPTPAIGWRNKERRSFLDRVHGDLGLWLALLHHLTITAGVPLSQSLNLAASMTRHAVIEFVSPDDPMVELIGASRSPEAAPYDRGTFHRHLGDLFEVLDELEVSPTRTLYFVRSRLRP